MQNHHTSLLLALTFATSTLGLGGCGADSSREPSGTMNPASNMSSGETSNVPPVGSGTILMDDDDTDKQDTPLDAFGKFPSPAIDLDQPGVTQAQAIFAGGCFWCTEAVFEQLKGVSDVVSGYAGGSSETANYSAVGRGDTGHAEAIRITYDPSQISYGQLMRVFFATHDPTQLNAQGPDTGTQYRSAIFFQNAEEKRVAAAYIKQLGDSKDLYKKPLVTTLEPLTKFYEAEKYHQDYAKLNPNQPYIKYHALPKVEKADKLFPELKQ